MRILFLCPYPFNTAPSQRFRFEQYFHFLKEEGFMIDHKPFWNKKTWNILYSPGNTFKKILGFLKGIISRFFLLFSVSDYDWVFIHRETAPLGPPVVEWIVVKILKKRIIYDFDDAIWLPNTSQTNKLAKFLKWHNKVPTICRWSYKVSCGNEYLCNYARKYNNRVVLMPTTIDTLHVHNPAMHNNKISHEIVIGWTGSHSTLKYLNDILPVLKKVADKFPKVGFHFISDQDPLLNLKNLTFKKWSSETEIKDLAAFDIGIMPLKHDLWSQGKCGFKALQYMAMKIPAVVSPVGVNTKIIADGQNGFLAESDQQWIQKLTLLIENAALREKIGTEGRHTVVSGYSVESQKKTFLKLFETNS